jgi:hypothetical protein
MYGQVGNNSNQDNLLDPSILYFEIPSFENGKPTPILGEIWIPTVAIIEQHYIKFYIHNMEKMFSERDRVIKVDHSGIVSKMSSWRLDTISKWIKKNLESIDFDMGLDQEGFSFYQVICNRGRILIFKNSKGASR